METTDLAHLLVSGPAQCLLLAQRPGPTQLRIAVLNLRKSICCRSLSSDRVTCFGLSQRMNGVILAGRTPRTGLFFQGYTLLHQAASFAEVAVVGLHTWPTEK